MSITAQSWPAAPTWPVTNRFYFGWVQVLLAALAMVATLPGRTQGLGLITEPLLRDLQISPVTYAHLNLWATLLGAMFALVSGRFVDRWGSRVVMGILALFLGLTVILMSRVTSIAPLGLALLLTRGLGQSALSAVSIGLVGQWFRGRLGAAMALFSVLLSMGFMLAFPLVEIAVKQHGWRAAWMLVGTGVAGLAPVIFVFGRRSPEKAGVPLDPNSKIIESEPLESDDYSFEAALRTPAFWIVAGASALYLLVASGISLFNERILVELGFDRSLFVNTLVVTALCALVGNFLGGWLMERGSLRGLLTTAMTLLAGGLFALPHLRTTGAVYAQAVVMGVAGGFVTVIFFAFWRRFYGRRELGLIQGAAQALTVLGSAVGPLVLAQSFSLTGSYAAVFRTLGVAVLVVATLAWITPLPVPRRSRQR